MSRKRYTPEQIIHMLREAEVLISRGMTAADAARQIGVAEQTYYRWRKEYGGMQVSRAKRLKALEKENLHFIDPGKPVQDAYIESFIARLRDECLSQHWFKDLTEARRIIEAWRQDYNESRPHTSLGYLTPLEFSGVAQKFKDECSH